MTLTHKELLKLHGKSVTCTIKGQEITDAKISVDEGRVYVCQNRRCGSPMRNRLGYEYSWKVSTSSDPYEKVAGYWDTQDIKLIEEKETERETERKESTMTKAESERLDRIEAAILNLVEVQNGTAKKPRKKKGGYVTGKDKSALNMLRKKYRLQHRDMDHTPFFKNASTFSIAFAEKSTPRVKAAAAMALMIQGCNPTAVIDAWKEDVKNLKGK